MEVDCSICDGSLKEGATVTVTSGLPTLIQASYARNDNFHEKWAGKPSLVLHVQCRKSYTRKTSIKADEKMREVASTSGTSTTLLPSASAFCRTSRCLFCGKNLNTKSKPSQDNKQTCLLADPNKVGSILSVAYSRKDSWGATVIARINAIGDLITAKVRYHTECNASFYRVQKFQTRGRLKSECMTEWIKDIIKYLESADECQHSIPDLIAKFPLSVEMTDKYAMTSLKAALKNKFGQRIIFPQNTKIVCLVHSLENHFPKKWAAEINESEAEGKLRIIKAAAKIIRSDIQSLTYDS
ncbi:unnamed protein product [Bemisia tabaci]|uniref:Uncharacterized protein n=1 Tax=Bemisia tabaci TaxID=7038 RepID=A0A9P0F4C8_BEMTA|nr:unnamed protein product [Bemisia tabaci]